jgi:acyl carrier protein
MPLDPDSVKAAARQVIAELTRRSVADDYCIVSSGLIDSLSVLKLISALEKKLAIRIPMENVQPEDFDSVEVIQETLARILP